MNKNAPLTSPRINQGASRGIFGDVTAYARRLGYTGDKPVIVQEGKVISHRQVCWVRFCEKLRGGIF